MDFAMKVSDHRTHVIGFIDDHWEFDGAPSTYRAMQLGRLNEISEVLRDAVVDEVVVLSPKLDRAVVNACHEQGVTVTHSFGSTSWRKPAAPLLSLIAPGFKRLMDIAFSGIVIVAILPLLAVIAIAVKLTSKGPAIFSQERLGLGKHPFMVLKFRTMVPNAESLMASIEHLNEAKGAHFKLRKDPRVTPIGALLRKTSLDELPQLFNVLRGDMSLVGPRPIVMRDYRGIAHHRHRRRFAVKPGITCLWQVGGRNSIDFDSWMELDLDYIDRWSLQLDLQILLKTIPVVIRGSGAM